MPPGPDATSPPPLPDDAVRSALARILDSRAFAKSSRMRKLLAFIVEESLADRFSNLKEYVLAVEVFDKSSDFDPRTDTIVRVECRRLRMRLEEYYRAEGSADPVRIELPRGGYGAVFSRNIPAAAAAPESAVTRVSVVWTGAAILCFVAAALLGWGLARHTPPSVAILPFANLTGHGPDSILAQGLADEVIDILTRSEGLRTIARGSSRRAIEREPGPREAGLELGVAHVVAGNIRREGSRVRITAQMIRVSDGASLWAGAFEHDSADPFEIEDELSKRIAGEVLNRLGVRPPAGRSPYVPSTAVNRLYLQGRYLWNQRSPASVRESIRFFEQAAARDPRFVLAQAALADSWAVLAMNEQAPVADAAARAKTAASLALRLDPALGEARATAAWLRFFHDWEFQQAEREFERAIRLRPGYATAHQWFGLALLSRGRFGRATREFEKALDLDPLSLIVLTDLAVVQYYQRRHEEAVQRAREALRLDGSFHYAHLVHGAAMLQLGRVGEAVEAMQRAVAASGREPDCLMRLGHALAAGGERERAGRILEELAGAGTHHQRAFVLAGLGRFDEALHHLERALHAREPSLLFARFEPAFDALRSLPRFEALLAAAGRSPTPLREP